MHHQRAYRVMGIVIQLASQRAAIQTQRQTALAAMEMRRTQIAALQHYIDNGEVALAAFQARVSQASQLQQAQAAAQIALQRSQVIAV